MDHKHTYTCVPCVYHTTCKRDYERHLLTQKHIDGGSLISKQIIKSSDGYLCPSCNNTFKSRTSIYKHISKCKTSSSQVSAAAATAATTAATTTATTATTAISTGPTQTDQYLREVIIKNQELTSAMMILIQQNTELQSKMMELCINNTGMSQSHNTNSLNTTNNNQQYSMNFFLNEKCKDAMNMKDFVNSIQLNLTDLENVDRVGYVKGMSTIIIDNLQKTDVYKRPVHCSDVKRETLYVKDDDKWEREGPDHTKMVNAVLAVEQKNVALVGEWAKANPRCMNSHTRENEKYFRLSKVVTDGEKDGNIAKVIRNVAKNVMVEKE